MIIDALHGETLHSHEFTAPADGGKEYNLLLNISVLRDERGTLLGSVVVGQDIKEHKRSELNRVSDGQDILTFFENTTTLTVGMDFSGLINIWNIQMTEVTGFTKEESVGKNFVQVRTLARK